MKMLLRSMLFVSAHNKKFIEKSLTTDADALVFDFEDAVPEEYKSEARDYFRTYLENGDFNRKTVFVRTNSLDSSHFIKDIDVSIHEDVTGFMPPKIQSQDDLVFLEKLLEQKENEYGIVSNHFKLAPLIETAASVLNLRDIVVNSNRLVAVCFGGEDFLNDLEGAHGSPPIAFETPRALIAMAARSVGVAPIDTPYLDLSDTEGFIKEKKATCELGFAGSLLINPKQIEPAHDSYSPTADEIEKSKQIIEAIKISEQKGAGCAMLEDQMIGPPMLRKARQIIEYTKLLEKKSSS